MYLLERQSYGERVEQREGERIFHLLVCFLKGYTNQDWAKNPECTSYRGGSEH